MIAEMVTAQKGIGSHCFILHGSAGMNPHDIHVCMYACMYACIGTFSIHFAGVNASSFISMNRAESELGNCVIYFDVMQV